VSAIYAQQTGCDTNRPSPRPVTTMDVRRWSAIKTARAPLSQPEGLKLRDVDIFIIESRCKGCSYCIEFCPKKVLEEGKKLNAIGIRPPRVKDSTLCVGCGVCENVCPDFAIYLLDKKGV
jgi:2-oxoglutarate ferredoxin oxidoreductase subunit delta